MVRQGNLNLAGMADGMDIFFTYNAVAAETDVVAGAYHALFAHTGFITQIGCNKKLLAQHQIYLRYVYKFAALPALVGGLAFFACVGSDASRLPRFVGCVAPPLSRIASAARAMDTGCSPWRRALNNAARHASKARLASPL